MLKGFIIGLALTIIVGQVPKLLGIEKTEGDFFEQAWGIIRHLGDIQARTLAIGALSLAVGSALRPRRSGLTRRRHHRCDRGRAVRPRRPRGRHRRPHRQRPPTARAADDVAANDYLRAAGAAAGLVLVGFAEGLGAAKTYAARAHYEVNANRELLGLGAANVGSGLASGMVVNGSLSKTAVNGSAGAHSQVSGLVVAVLTVITLLFLTGLLESLPEATLAAVVIAAVRAAPGRTGANQGQVAGQECASGSDARRDHTSRYDSRDRPERHNPFGWSGTLGLIETARSASSGEFGRRRLLYRQLPESSRTTTRVLGLLLPGAARPSHTGASVAPPQSDPERYPRQRTAVVLAGRGRQRFCDVLAVELCVATGCSLDGPWSRG